MSRGTRMGSRRFPQNALLKEIGASFYQNQQNQELFPAYSISEPEKVSYEEKRISELYDVYINQLKKSEFYLEEPPPPKDIERYSDKYFVNEYAHKDLKNASIEGDDFDIDEDEQVSEERYLSMDSTVLQPRLSKRQQKLAQRQQLYSKTNNSAFRNIERNFKNKFSAPDMTNVVDLSRIDSLPKHVKDNIVQVNLKENLFDLDPLLFSKLEASEDQEGTVKQSAYTLKNHPGVIIIPNPFTNNTQRRLVKNSLCNWARFPNRNNLNPFFVLEGSESIFELHLKNVLNKNDPEYKEVIIQSRFSDKNANYENVPKIKSENDSTEYTENDSIDGNKKQKFFQTDQYAENTENCTNSVESNCNKNKCSAEADKVTVPKNGMYKHDLSASALYSMVRWTTIGKQYNWSTKAYDIDQSFPISDDLKHLTMCIVRSIENAKANNTDCSTDDQNIINDYECRKYLAEAGVINYYGLDDTLLAHVDRSEENTVAPLISISLGCSGIYLLGGITKQDPVTPILLNSGDVMACCGPARAAYHGVPRIFENTCPEFLLNGSYTQEEQNHNQNIQSPTQDLDQLSKSFSDYISNHRINFNIRQWSTRPQRVVLPLYYNGTNGALPGIEPGTSRTLSENHTARPQNQLK
ncbi:hypothetical protein BB560_001725, partial [Smittium megazygosporum]